MKITSGWRCEPHNVKEGGKPDSPHLKGMAVDISCPESRDRFIMLFHALGLFRRIGIGKNFLHVDVDKEKDQEVIWLY
jgi:hypothetical protein